LLSPQHVPNLLSVHHFQPDRLILLESAGMKAHRMAAHFLNALKLGGLDYEGRLTIQSLEAEDDLDSIRKSLQEAFGRFPSDAWTVNLTGGTKPMSIAAYEFFKARGGRIIYTNVTRPAVIRNVISGEAIECTHRPRIREFLAGYGFEFRKDAKTIQESESRASQWSDCATLLARHATGHSLVQLDEGERKKGREKGLELSPERIAPQIAPVIHNTLMQTIWKDNNAATKLSKYEVEFLTGGWLEVFFWDLLSRHANELGLWDIRLGLEVGRNGDSATNEFDVTFMRQHALAMVECKSGAQEHDPGSDILYKVEAVTRQFRAIRVQSFLATTGAKVLGADQQIKRTLRDRSDIYNCRILTTSTIQDLARPSISAAEISNVLFSGNGG